MRDIEGATTTRIIAEGDMYRAVVPQAPVEPTSRIVYEGLDRVTSCSDALSRCALPTHQLSDPGATHITVIHGVQIERVTSLKVQERRSHRIPRLGWRTVTVFSDIDLVQAASTTRR